MKTLTKFEELRQLVQEYNIIIEGYNYVGKSYLINKLESDTHIVVDRRKTEVLPESIRWTYLFSFMSMFDFFKKDLKFIMNRSILSAAFYNKVRDPQIQELITLEIFDWFTSLVRKNNIMIILIEVDKSKYKRFIKERSDIIDPDDTYLNYQEFNQSIKKTVEFLELKDNFYIYKNETLV